MEFPGFEDFLRQKKIDPELFQAGDPVTWDEYQKLFYEVHPDSFTARKLYQINRIRRQFPFREKTINTSPAEAAVKPRMPLRPKFK